MHFGGKMALSKGAEYLSYDDFEADLNSHCATNHCLFVKRSSGTMKDGLLAHLKYEHIVFGCKQGEKRHKAACTGIRPQQRTLKVGCPAKLRLTVVRLNDKSRPPFLRLTICDLEHSNHQVNKDVCQLYPENRRVVLDEVSQLLASSATIKTSELKVMLEQRHKRPLLYHDVYNLKQSLKPSLMAYDADSDKLRTCQRQHLIEANSIRVDHRDDDSVSRDITCSLTKFAAAHVKNQLTCARQTSYEITARDGLPFVVSYEENSHDTTVDSCSCSFFNQMSRLPCRHIFALRSHLGQYLFSSSIVPECFLLSSVRPEAAIIKSEVAEIVVDDVPTSYATQEGRYRKIKAFCDSLIASMTVVGQQEFSEKIAHLEHLVDFWNQRNTDISPTGTDILPTDTDNILPTDSGSILPSDTGSIPPTDTDNISPTDTDTLPTDNISPTDTDSLWPKMKRVLKPRRRPAKRQMFTRVNKRKRDAPVKFNNLSLISQQQLLVSSVFDNVTGPFSSNQFKITDLKPNTLFGDLVMETSVNLDIIKPLMDSSTWNCLVDGIETRRDGGIFTCGGCREIDNGEHKMILCEQCLVWTHCHCAGYRSNMKVLTWFCRLCMCGVTL